MTAFVTDSFTGTNGTNITAHTGELGATWTKHASATNTGDPQIQSNRLQTTESAVNENYYASGTPSSADYSVTLDYTFNGIGGSELIGPAARMTTGATNSGYFFIYFRNVAELRLYKYVAGTLTQIGAGVAFAPVSGTTYRLTVDAAGTAIAARMQRLSDSTWINSAGAFGASQVNCASATDSAITAAGKAGFWYSSDTSGGGARGTLDNFSAAQVGGPATGITTSGPSGGTVGVASTNFTVGVTPGGATITGTVIVTMSDSAGGGTFTPATVSLTTASPNATFTYTPASVGAKTISVTNNGGLTNPANTTYTATAAAIYNTVNATDTIGGENIMVLVPSSTAGVPYNPANPTNVILYVHGSGEDQTGLTSDGLKFAVRDALINAGYILAGTNAQGPSNWGNQASVDSYAALDKYVRDNYNVKNVALWSQSMGGLAGLSALAQGKIKVVGWLGTYPVCNLANLYALGTYAGAINSAYGITGVGIATYANRTYGNDPALMRGFAWRHVPMRFYASSGDTVVPKANNTDVLAALVAGSCRESTVVACTGNHGDPSHFDATSYLAFFARCFATPAAQGQPASTKTVSITLRDSAGATLPSLTGLYWRFFDQVGAVWSEYPTDQGSGATTNGSGVMTITVHTALSAGGIGRLEVTNSDGTTAQSPVAKAFVGPVAVA